MKQGKYHSFYISSRWRALREAILRANNYLCVECQKKGLIKIATVGHHIKPIETHYELRLDPENIMPVCRECHETIEGRGGNKIAQFIEMWEGL